VRVDRHLGRLPAGAQQRRERDGALGLAEHEDLADARSAGRLDGLVEEGGDGEQVAGTGVGELGGELLDRVQGLMVVAIPPASSTP
jgi:hypothetical protein